jgi:hypothetical protein
MTVNCMRSRLSYSRITTFVNTRLSATVADAVKFFTFYIDEHESSISRTTVEQLADEYSDRQQIYTSNIIQVAYTHMQLVVHAVFSVHG